MRRLVGFCLAGGVGLCVDAAALALMISATPFGPFVSRLLSIALAMTATWMLNRRLTFGPSGRSLTGEATRYVSVGLAASLFNYILYSAMLLTLPGLPPLGALALASAAAMMISFLGYSRLVFHT